MANFLGDSIFLTKHSSIYSVINVIVNIDMLNIEYIKTSQFTAPLSKLFM